MSGALPEEVVERLSTCGPVRLSAGDDGAAAVEGNLAPLRGQLYALVTRGGATERALRDTGRIVVEARDRDSEWSVRLTGRAVAGRTVIADSRRSELVHWVPEGVRPAELVAVRVHPETIEYVRGKGAGRTRAAGPVPGGPGPAPLRRWTTLATEGMEVWYVGLFVVCWVGALLLLEGWAQFVGYGNMLTGGGCLLGGTILWAQAARYERWREGLESDRSAGRMLEGWEPASRVRRVGVATILAGLVIIALAGAVLGWGVAMVTIAASGVPVILPFFVFRHALRRSDAVAERGAD